MSTAMVAHLSIPFLQIREQGSETLGHVPNTQVQTLSHKLTCGQFREGLSE